MKLIIAGSRTIDVDPDFLRGAIKFFNLEPTEIVSGCAKGVDKCGELYAVYVGNVPIKKFPADWTKYGRAAGPKRNEQMAKEADALLLIWDGGSNGSRNMKQNMKHLGKPVYEVILMGDK